MNNNENNLKCLTFNFGKDLPGRLTPTPSLGAKVLLVAETKPTATCSAKRKQQSLVSMCFDLDPLMMVVMMMV